MKVFYDKDCDLSRIKDKAGAPTLQSRRRFTAEHQIEVVGANLRAMMPWTAANQLVDRARN